MRRARTTRLAALAMFGASMARLAAANVTINYYSLLTTTATGPTPAFTHIIADTIAGIAPVSVQVDGETVYAETLVATLDALAAGTSTATPFLSTPTTVVLTFAEDASRYSASRGAVLTLPGETVSFGAQIACTGAAAARATCVVDDVNSLGTAVSFTETVAAVRTPDFTITASNSGALTAGPRTAVVVVALAVAAVCAVV
ncbi:hypothetical protein HYPSUDRAFT_49967 [Hypholoma sublateritium FD-334 SS-4]|uniref:Uncharacterized protein n=1 Tax=Hypholoma sublateritium (strain FD-334 SS-4) TaxID=945553 RepID=A0A0D2N9A2_HYPSF|nr:hypothetical protein HYPSUDRAFT_49967 [Hypholoma sublateritium FD-334 SS-4]